METGSENTHVASTHISQAKPLTWLHRTSNIARQCNAIQKEVLMDLAKSTEDYHTPSHVAICGFAGT